MMDDAERLEMFRERWRRGLAARHLLDPTCPDFASVGLGGAGEDTNVRLLILPGDPEAYRVEFDHEFWAWWEPERIDPLSGQKTLWGSEFLPSADLAVRYRSVTDDAWKRFVGVSRAGGLEVGLGRDGCYTAHQNRGSAIERELRVFRLLTIVGRLAAAIALYSEVVEKYSVDGPWRLVLALRGTKGALLGDVGRGWADVDSYEHEHRPCRESNLVVMREYSEWPDVARAQEVAFSLGGQIEDAWGWRTRRFLARVEPDADKFDLREYQWS